MLDFETSTTPVEAPFRNGIAEKNNKILYEPMMKTMEDLKCAMPTALPWTISPKNVLQNVNGYSPIQLVFSMNVTLPSVLTDKPPALDSSCQSDLIQKIRAVIHSAR